MTEEYEREMEFDRLARLEEASAMRCRARRRWAEMREHWARAEQWWEKAAKLRGKEKS